MLKTRPNHLGENNRIFGGYTSLDWMPAGKAEKAEEDEEAFIFSLDHLTVHRPFPRRVRLA